MQAAPRVAFRFMRERALAGRQRTAGDGRDAGRGGLAEEPGEHQAWCPESADGDKEGAMPAS